MKGIWTVIAILWTFHSIKIYSRALRLFNEQKVISKHYLVMWTICKLHFMSKYRFQVWANSYQAFVVDVPIEILVPFSSWIFNYCFQLNNIELSYQKEKSKLIDEYILGFESYLTVFFKERKTPKNSVVIYEQNTLKELQ